MASRIDESLSVNPGGERRSAPMKQGPTPPKADGLALLVEALLAHAEEELERSNAVRGGQKPRPGRNKGARASEDTP